MGCAPENQVRSRLPAGGSRIRALGPPEGTVFFETAPFERSGPAFPVRKPRREETGPPWTDHRSSSSTGNSGARLVDLHDVIDVEAVRRAAGQFRRGEREGDLPEVESRPGNRDAGG